MFFAFCCSLFSQVRIDFSKRTAVASPTRSIYSVNGDFAMIGNTNMTLLDYEEDLMNDGMMVFVDVDADPETVNSSSATLDFSDENGADSKCSRVLFAGLYWSGRGPSSATFNVTKDGVNKQLDKRKVKIKGPGQENYIELEVLDDAIRYPASLDTDLGMFVGYKEVTEWVREWGEGEYTVADIGLQEGTNYHYGGWGMVVVYENPLMKKRDITVFDGYAFVRGQGAASYDIQVSGFSATESGDVNVKVGLMAGEGDVGADGDYFAIERGENSNNFERLSHGNNESNNFFNSSIHTGGNARNPDLKNNTGMDISVFELDNQGNAIIGNNQTNTKFRYGSTWDVYVIYNITMAVDANDVAVETFHELRSVNGIEVDGNTPEISPGDELEIRATIKNKGKIAINQSKIEIPLPEGLTFLEATPDLLFTQETDGEYSFLPERGPGGKIVWEMGSLPVPEDSEDVLGIFNYTLRASENCQELLAICSGELEIDGKLFGENALTQTDLDPIPFIISFNQSKECFNEPLKGPLVFDFAINDFLREKCGWNIEGLEIPVCVSDSDSIDVENFSGFFPEGTQFFESPPQDSEEQGFGIGQGLLMENDELTLYAVHSSGTECYQTFKIIRNDFSLEPKVTSVSHCNQSIENEIGVEVFGGMKPFTYLWDDPSHATTATLKDVEPGEYNVTVTDSLGCKVETLVTVPDIPPFSLEILEAESNLDLGCDSESNGLIAVAVEGENSPFILDIIGEYGSDSTFSEQIIIPTSGVYEIPDLKGGMYSLTLADINGCTLNQTIEISQIEVADLQTSFTFTSESHAKSGFLFQNSEIQFYGEANSSQVLSYHWDFGNGRESTEQQPIIRYAESGHYLVRLLVEDENGCVATYEEYLEITDFFIRVPTAFSPNGNDSNDYFFPVFSDLNNIQFWVFNRWGELLYFTADVNSRGWDGRHKGIEMPVGNYLYKLIYTDKEGVENQKTGPFSLVK